MTQFHFIGIFMRIINKSVMSEHRLRSHALMELLKRIPVSSYSAIRVNDTRKNPKPKGEKILLMTFRNFVADF